MSEEPRIGVYICHCGLNIAGVINVKEVAEFAKKLPNVVVARDYVFMCSAPGQDLIKEDIKKYKLNRVVVAACSPSMHEPTFRGVLREAGLNPYLLEMANIREHSSWVHPEEPEAATEKAKDLVKMAVAKVRLLEPLEDIKVAVEPSALIIGGGVSGLRAALDLAERGVQVYLVERSPTLGGWAGLLGRLAHTERKGWEVVKNLVEAVARNPRINIYTCSEVVKLDGSIGNFEATIKRRPRYVDMRCTKCGRCEEICPVEVPNEYEAGLTSRKAIYLPAKWAYPSIYAIDEDACTRCGKCVEVCEPKAINLDEKPEEFKVKVGALILAAGFKPYEPEKGEFGYELSKRVITLLQLERLLDEAGPTGGRLVVDGVEPKSIAFILCVGSLSTTPRAAPYCSRVCCSASLHSALKIKELDPEIDIYVIHKDIRTYGRLDERLYERASESFVKFVRFEEAPEVRVKDEGLEVEVYDTIMQERLLIPVDLVVLAVGMTPAEGLDELVRVVKVGCGPEGFVREAHAKLRPVEAPADGIFLAGTVSGPKNVAESIASGDAAAAKAAALAMKAEVVVEPIVARVDEDLCSGCGVCEAMCPYGAVTIQVKEEKRVSVIDEALCKGCGTCGAACPSGAIQQSSYKDDQIRAQIIALFEGGGGG